MIVTESTTDIPTPTGPMRAYLYSPRQPGRPEKARPGLLLYSEIFQQTAPVKRLAISLASFGYLVAVPEVYHSHEAPGTVLGYDDIGKERGNALKGMIPMRAFDDDAMALVRAPQATSQLQWQARCHGNLPWRSLGFSCRIASRYIGIGLLLSYRFTFRYLGVGRQSRLTWPGKRNPR